MIILHIAVALSSIVFTTLAYFARARWALRAAYVTAGATLASGVYLVWIMPSRLLHVCVAGIVYLSIVSVGIVFARSKIALAERAGAQQ